MPGLYWDDSTSDIIKLYANVLDDNARTYRVKEYSIRKGIRDMANTYRGNPLALQTIEKEDLLKTQYNLPAFRCAYLHKYAACHTGLVCDMLKKCVLENPSVLAQMAILQPLKLCSLGGGPGSDVIAVLLVLSAVFNNVFRSDVTIVDCMGGWNATFNSVVRELSSGGYGKLSLAIHPTNFYSSYLSSDLLDTFEEEVRSAISAADFVTMVKFVSAAACVEIRSMVQEIFISMKPGALVLFIDNAAGGFYELVAGVARDLRFKTMFGPLKHYLYQNEAFSVTRYNSKSLSETRVSVQIWKKHHDTSNQCLSGKRSGLNTGRRITPSPTVNLNTNIRQPLDRIYSIGGYSANSPVRQASGSSSSQRNLNSARRNDVLPNVHRNPTTQSSSHRQSLPVDNDRNNFYARQYPRTTPSPTNDSSDLGCLSCCLSCCSVM